MEQDHLILKYLQGTLSDEEHIDFDQWMNQSDENRKMIEDLQRVWRASNLKTTPVDFGTAQEWEKLQLMLDKENNIPIRKLTTSSYSWRAAAAIAFIFVSTLLLYLTFFRAGEVVYQTTNLTKHLILPDSSEVWLNENSRLTYNKDFNNERSLSLEGEAFFDVKRNPKKPFVIGTTEAKIKVLGTSFNVKAYSTQPQTEVYVVSGKVNFTTVDEHNHLVLTAGSNGVLNKVNHTMSSGTETYLNILAWKNKELVFKKTPLREVLKTVRTYFKTDIQVKNEGLLNCRFTSTFKDPTLAEVVEAISLALNLKIVHQSNMYTLDGEGCYSH